MLTGLFIVGEWFPLRLACRAGHGGRAECIPSATGSSKTATTAHLVVPSGLAVDACDSAATRQLRQRFQLDHGTLQGVRELFSTSCQQATTVAVSCLQAVRHSGARCRGLVCRYARPAVLILPIPPVPTPAPRRAAPPIRSALRRWRPIRESPSQSGRSPVRWQAPR